MNIERIYTTTLSPEEIAQTLAEHFRLQEFETQVFQSSAGRTVMQARKENLWRQALGIAYAMTVIITPSDGKLAIELGGHEWVDPPLAPGLAW
jgi:hypothetical protein